MSPGLTFTYDFANYPMVAYVRLLIPDNNSENFVFSDTEIGAFYAIQQSTFQSAMYYSPPAGQQLPSQPLAYLRVAALALDTLASNKAKLASITRLLDVELKPADAAKALHAQAEAYRDIDDNAGAFMIIEQVNNDATLLDRYWKQVQRQQGVPF